MILENRNQFPDKKLCTEKEGKGEQGEGGRKGGREEGSGFRSGHAAAYELLLKNAIIKLSSWIKRYAEFSLITL